MAWVHITVAAAAGLYALHRLAIYLEDWGYIYYRRKRTTSGGSPVYCPFQEMIQPQIRHVIRSKNSVRSIRIVNDLDRRSRSLLRFAAIFSSFTRSFRMRVASRSLAIVVWFFAGMVGQAQSDEATRPTKATRAYAVVCRIVSETPKSGTTQPLDVTTPRMIVSNGAAATISDTSETAFAFGDGESIQGKRAVVERKVTEGMKIEATVIAQDQNQVVLDLAIELSSAEAPQREGAPVRVNFEKGRWIERVELDKPVTLAARHWHVEATVMAVSETDADVGPLREKVSNTAADQPQAQIAYVKYTGNRIGRRHLDKQTGLRPGQPLDVAQVRAGREKLLAYYREKGFANVAVSIKEGAREGDRGVVYQISEGEPGRSRKNIIMERVKLSVQR